MASTATASPDIARERDREVPLWRLYLLRAVPVLAMPWGIGLVADMIAAQPTERGMIDSLLIGL